MIINQLPPPPALSGEPLETMAHMMYMDSVIEAVSNEVRRLETPGLNVGFQWIIAVDDDDSAYMARGEAFYCEHCATLHRRTMLWVESDAEETTLLDMDYDQWVVKRPRGRL